jgi:predicted anti-sigma-YlaC factor YlaD
VANPEASSYLAREARVLAVGYLTLGLLAAILAWRPIRAGSSWALVALWIFTTGMLATSLVFFGAGDTAIGATYLTAAVVSAGALIIAARSPAQRP